MYSLVLFEFYFSVYNLFLFPFFGGFKVCQLVFTIFKKTPQESYSMNPFSTGMVSE